jgi:hypothetical protein
MKLFAVLATLVLLFTATESFAQSRSERHPSNSCHGGCDYIGRDGDPYKVRMCQNIYDSHQYGYVPGCEWTQPRESGQCNYIGRDGDPYKVRMCQNIFDDRQCGYVPGCEWERSCN